MPKNAVDDEDSPPNCFDDGLKEQDGEYDRNYNGDDHDVFICYTRNFAHPSHPPKGECVCMVLPTIASINGTSSVWRDSCGRFNGGDVFQPPKKFSKDRASASEDDRSVCVGNNVRTDGVRVG